MKSVLERWILNYSTWLDNNTKWDQTDSPNTLETVCLAWFIHANVMRGYTISLKASVPLFFPLKAWIVSYSHKENETLISDEDAFHSLWLEKTHKSKAQCLFAIDFNWGLITYTMNCSGSCFLQFEIFSALLKDRTGLISLGHSAA